MGVTAACGAATIAPWPVAAPPHAARTNMTTHRDGPYKRALIATSGLQESAVVFPKPMRNAESDTAA
jgi:hypothetical protein